MDGKQRHVVTLFGTLHKEVYCLGHVFKDVLGTQLPFDTLLEHVIDAL